MPRMELAPDEFHAPKKQFAKQSGPSKKLQFFLQLYKFHCINIVAQIIFASICTMDWNDSGSTSIYENAPKWNHDKYLGNVVGDMNV